MHWNVLTLFLSYSFVMQSLTLSIMLTVKSSGQGSDMLSSQVQHAELLLKTSERLKQMRFVLLTELCLIFCKSSCLLLHQCNLDQSHDSISMTDYRLRSEMSISGPSNPQIV